MARKPQPAGMRFRRLVAMHGAGPNDCWLWRGAKSSSGYGSFRPGDGTTESAHRYAYWLLVGQIPEGKCVCHSCDNPLCVNPAHLWIGTKADNNRDKSAKGRASHDGGARGERNYTAKLTADQVLAIRASTEVSRVLAERYGVCRQQIDRIKRAKEWRHMGAAHG